MLSSVESSESPNSFLILSSSLSRLTLRPSPAAGSAFPTLGFTAPPLLYSPTDKPASAAAGSSTLTLAAWERLRLLAAVASTDVFFRKRFPGLPGSLLDNWGDGGAEGSSGGECRWGGEGPRSEAVGGTV